MEDLFGNKPKVHGAVCEVCDKPFQDLTQGIIYPIKFIFIESLPYGSMKPRFYHTACLQEGLTQLATMYAPVELASEPHQ